MLLNKVTETEPRMYRVIIKKNNKRGDERNGVNSILFAEK